MANIDLTQWDGKTIGAAANPEQGYINITIGSDDLFINIEQAYAIHAALGEAVAEYDWRGTMTALTLYRCAADVQAALDYYFDSETEREDTLEAVIGQFEVKAQSVIAYIKNQEITEKMLEGHIRRMTGKLKAVKAQNQSLKDYLARNMQVAGITEIKADDGTFKALFRKSEAVVILDEAQIPAEFMREGRQNRTGQNRHQKSD